MSPGTHHDATDEVLAAIKAEDVIEFMYSRTPDNHTRRVFSPFEVRNKSVIGWDHGKDELRRFELSKMGPTAPRFDLEYVRPH